MTTRICDTDDCDRTHYARGWCVTHYRRWQRYGHPRVADPIISRGRDRDEYGAAMQRLRRQRGPASRYACAECGTPAACWSYDGTDPEPRTHHRGHRYSLEPTHYRARCRFCHRQAVTARIAGMPGPDTPRRQRFDLEHATALYNAGATCHGIGALMGVSANAVHRALRAHNIAMRPPGRQRHQNHG
jgi:hypothetical protein